MQNVNDLCAFWHGYKAERRLNLQWHFPWADIATYSPNWVSAIFPGTIIPFPPLPFSIHSHFLLQRKLSLSPVCPISLVVFHLAIFWLFTLCRMLRLIASSLLIALGSGSFCGDSTVPFSLEVRISPCSRWSCILWILKQIRFGLRLKIELGDYSFLRFFMLDILHQITPDGLPLLGCARPTCFGWAHDGKRATNTAYFERVNGWVVVILLQSPLSSKFREHCIKF